MTAAADLPDWIRNVSGTSKAEFSGFVAGGAGTTVNVAQYESVQILLGNLDHASFLCVVYKFIDPQTGFVMETGLLTADANFSLAGDGLPSWTLPVVSGQLVLVNLTGGAPTAVVIGRPVRSPKMMNNDYFPVRTFQGSVPANSPNGTRTQLPGQDGNNPVPALRDCSSYNGAVAVLVVAGGAITGQVQFRYRNDAGATVDTGVFSNPGTSVQQLNIGHPFAYISWSFLCTAVSPAAAIAVKVVLVPAEVSG